MLYDNRSSGAGGGRHTIVSDIFPYRTAERVYPTCTRTTKLKLAVGALCWDNFIDSATEIVAKPLVLQTGLQNTLKKR